MSAMQTPSGRAQRAPTPDSDGFNAIPATPAQWVDLTSRHGFIDITYKLAVADGTARIAINRPAVHNAFRPTTVSALHGS